MFANNFLVIKKKIHSDCIGFVCGFAKAVPSQKLILFAGPWHGLVLEPLVYTIAATCFYFYLL